MKFLSFAVILLIVGAALAAEIGSPAANAAPAAPAPVAPAAPAPAQEEAHTEAKKNEWPEFHQVNDQVAPAPQSVADRIRAAASNAHQIVTGGASIIRDAIRGRETMLPAAEESKPTDDPNDGLIG